MKIFEDLISGTEIISDAYQMELFAEEAYCTIQSKMVVSKDVEVDVGCGNAFGGVNEDEEAGGPVGGNPVEKVNNLIDAFGYLQTPISKEDWIDYFKGFVKAVLAKKTANKATAEEIASFKKGAGAYQKYIFSKWNDLTVYLPKDGIFENSTIFSFWLNEEDEAPVFIFYLGGCRAFKV